MSKGGRTLELLVAFIESALVPRGFSVTHGEKVYNEAGSQLAEFDIIIRGPIGGGSISWLIECRDRPAAGAADGQWIQAVASRRDLFKFDKVTAVSTSGFSPSAIHAARELNVELRRVETVTPDSFGWALLGPMTYTSRQLTVKRAKILFSPLETEADLASAKDAITGRKISEPLFRVSNEHELRSVFDTVNKIVDHFGHFENIVPNTQPQTFSEVVHFTESEPRLVLPIASQDVPVMGIDYELELSVTVAEIPIASVSQYIADDGQTISENIQFEAMPVGGAKMAVALHNIPDQGTHVVLYRLE